MLFTLSAILATVVAKGGGGGGSGSTNTGAGGILETEGKIILCGTDEEGSEPCNYKAHLFQKVRLLIYAAVLVALFFYAIILCFKAEYDLINRNQH